MSNDAKEQIKYVLTLLRAVDMTHGLSAAVDDKGHILFFSTAEYEEKGNVKDCDGVGIDIQNLVR